MNIDYGSSTSTKTNEQQRRDTQSISADILFDCDVKVMTIQTAFLSNSKSNSSLIKKMTAGLQIAYYVFVILQMVIISLSQRR